ncbi:MAG: ABC transporter ATP-binding protein [Geminicoccaceae bacterium]
MAGLFEGAVARQGPRPTTMTLRHAREGASSVRTCIAFNLEQWRRRRPLVVGIVACVIGATMADVFMPLLSGRLVDTVAQAGADRDAALRTLLWTLAGMVGLGVAMTGLRHVAFLGITRLTLGSMSDIVRAAFWRVQRLSTDWHANSFAGSTVRKLTRGMWGLDLLNDTLLIALLPAIVVLVGSTVLLALHWPVLGVVVGLGALAYIAMTSFLSLAYVAPAARLSNSWDTKVGGALADAISCNAVVKAFGAESREDARLGGVIDKWSRRTRRTWYRGTTNGSIQALTLVLLLGAVIATTVRQLWTGAASAGDVAYVLTAFFVIQGYLRDVGMHIRNLQRSVNDMEELVEITTQPLGVADHADATPIHIQGGRIEFDAVTFHYRGHDRPLYEDLSLIIRAGERVGLVGHSGSGKTTFVKLIQRLHDVSRGRILIDGQDIAFATQESLRAQIAIVQQEPILFHRSLAENIGYARPGATQREIERAAMLANAHDFIAKLPRGYLTLVGERGVKLSGGERQRVALARAFLADAPILILDEATSSLDSESEHLIQEAMSRLLVGRTSIVIAHRLSTVRAMDRILVFDRGRIVEEGPHEALVARSDGVYRRLFDRQTVDLVTGLAA